MDDIAAIKAVVRAYAKAIHTQDEDDFRGLWSRQALCTLISVGKLYRGIDAIVDDFLIGAIHRLYSSIELVVDSIEVNLVDEAHATVIFGYRTECVRRETGEPYGIQGLETQNFVREDGSWRLQHVHYSKVS